MKSLSLEDLCIHQVCIWKQSNFKESLECLARNGVFKTALWKPLLDNTELKKAKKAGGTGGSPRVAAILEIYRADF